ncbi:MAG: hypothetical protein KHY31_12325 [Clostridiales bacterium]|nr:hypothetical protein [Clostridiales bacterium]
MAVCYLFANYEVQYKCEYILKKEFIEVDIDYDIEKEIETENGIILWGNNIKFEERDILIIDSQNKTNYLLKNAYYAGRSSIYGTPDGGSKTKFRTINYFKHGNYEKLIDLKTMPKVSRIRVFSKSINKLIGYPSLKMEKSDKEYVIKLSKEKSNKSISLNNDGIKDIVVSDDWTSKREKTGNLIINFNGYIEITLTKRNNYTEVSSFVNELVIFMQLYFPDNFSVDKIWCMVDENYYELITNQMEVKCTKRYTEKTVEVGLLEFLSNCYNKIPYRKSKNEIRNIPYIVINTSRNIEDNFLMFYRFIECYYKKQNITNIRKRFVSYSIRNNYASAINWTDEQIESYSQEITCLRNHYVHSGYFIKNSSLKISFEKIDGKKNPKDYTVSNLNISWIYERTKILYRITLDIIFREMLGYDDYNFEKRF